MGDDFFKLKDGSLAISLETFAGMYHADQLSFIAKFCEDHSVASKITEDQRIVVFVKKEDLASLSDQAAALGMSLRSYQKGLHQPISCLGEFCPHHKQNVLQDSLRISEEFAKISIKSTPLRIGINGCERCCVPTQHLDISLMGTEDGYTLFLGGQSKHLAEAAQLAAEMIPGEKLAILLPKLISAYQSKSQATESGLPEGEEQSFREVLERDGFSEYLKILAPYSQNAPGASDFSSASSMDFSSYPHAEGQQDMKGLGHNQDIKASTEDELELNFDFDDLKDEEIPELSNKDLQPLKADSRMDFSPKDGWVVQSKMMKEDIDPRSSTHSSLKDMGDEILVDSDAAESIDETLEENLDLSDFEQENESPSLIDDEEDLKELEEEVLDSSPIQSVQQPSYRLDSSQDVLEEDTEEILDNIALEEEIDSNSNDTLEEIEEETEENVESDTKQDEEEELTFESKLQSGIDKMNDILEEDSMQQENISHLSQERDKALHALQRSRKKELVTEPAGNQEVWAKEPVASQEAWAFEGIDFKGSSLVLFFSRGGTIELPLQTLSQKKSAFQLRLGPKTVELSLSEQAVQIQVEGIKMRIPRPL